MLSHELHAACLPSAIASTAVHSQISNTYSSSARPPDHHHHTLTHQQLPSTSASCEHEDDAPNFDCNICLDLCYEPVVTMCGHLFCWPCLYHWLSCHSVSKQCPVCKEDVENRVIPMYGRGRTASAQFLAENFAGMNVPCCPSPFPCRPEDRSTSASSFYGRDLQNSVDHVQNQNQNLLQSSNLGIDHLLLHFLASLLPSYISPLSARRPWIQVLAEQRRFNNEKEFVMHWGFIVVALLASLGFVLC